METGDFSEEIKQDKKKEVSKDNHKKLIYWEVLRNKTRDRWAKGKLLFLPHSSASAFSKFKLEKQIFELKRLISLVGNLTSLD